MLSTPWLLPVLLASLLPAAASQVQFSNPVRLPAAGANRAASALLSPSGPVVTIGDGVHSTGMFTGTDESPFVAALAALPDGGTVSVGAGTYAFSNPVVVSTEHVLLESRAARLVSSPGPEAGIFDIQASDVEIEGFEFREDVDSALDHALVRISSSGVRLRDCQFVGVAASGAPQFVLLTGVHDESWIQANRFQPDTGWTCVREEGGRGLHLTGNSVIGEDGMTGMAYGFHLVNSAWTEISGNTFLGIGSAQDPVEAVILVENVSGEGHHSIISDNALHLIVARRGIHLAGSQFSVVSGNAIGRVVGSELLAVLDIDSGPQGTGARSTVVSGNEFHNAMEATMIRINGIDGISVTSNQFSIVGGTAVFVGDQEVAQRVTVAMNSFGANTTVQPLPAVRIAGGDGHVVLGNSFHGFLVNAVDMAGVPPSACVVDLNIED